MAEDDAMRTLATRVEQAPYAARLGLRVEEVRLDRVRCRVPYKDENSNPGRALHGGVAASTIDIAGSLAAATGFASTRIEEAGTLDLSVVYLAAAIGEDVLAEADVLRRGKEIVYANVDVRTDAGKQIARGLVTHRVRDRPPRTEPDRQRVTPGSPASPTAADIPPGAHAFVTLPFMAGLGLQVARMQNGAVQIRMPFRIGNADQGNAVHEGALAALIDTAGALASWSIVGLDFRLKASTLGIHTSFHAQAIEEDVIADAQTWRRNDEIFLNHVTVSGTRSKSVVATGTVTYRIVVPD